MSLNRLFELIEETRETADCKAAFGEPRQVEGRTIIPVAQVSRGFGLGFGQGAEPTPAEGAEAPTPAGEGAGGGAGASSKPLGVIVVAGDQVSFESTLDEGKIALVALAVGALAVWELGKTLRALFGGR
jgi:uncharacterized spore protein YtfJ